MPCSTGRARTAMQSSRDTSLSLHVIQGDNGWIGTWDLVLGAQFASIFQFELPLNFLRSSGESFSGLLAGYPPIPFNISPTYLYFIKFPPLLVANKHTFELIWLFIMENKIRTEACFVVPKVLYRRVSKLPPFVNRTAFLRLIVGKRHIDHVKLVSKNKWPRKDTKSYEFCLRLTERLDRIEPLAKELHKVARGR